MAPKDAATTCRDATHVLQEAIQQLSAAANVFDGQAAKANEAPVVQGPVAANVVAAPVAQAGKEKAENLLDKGWRMQWIDGISYGFITFITFCCSTVGVR